MQNQEVFQDSELQEGFDSVNRLSFLHLYTTPPTTTTATTLFSDPHCTGCGTSTKRRSPSSPYLLDTTKPNSDSSEPKSKRLMMVQEDDLPVSFSPTFVPSPSPVLRRCFSDPYNSPGTTQPDSGNGSAAFLNQQFSPDNSAVKVIGLSPTRGNSSLPPRPPVLHRTVSDPIPSAYLIPVAGQALARSNSGLSNLGDLGVSSSVDTIKEESPNSKRLARMKDRMREMNKWLGEVMREGEDDASEDNNRNTRQDALGSEADEEVSVERLEEGGLSINFRCQCGKGCQILLSGSNCYYKLI